MNKTVILIVGGICTGKSSIADKILQKHNGKLLSLGYIMIEEAKEYNRLNNTQLSTTEYVFMLINNGVNLANFVFQKYMSNVLDNDLIIIEGIHFKEQWENLKSIFEKHSYKCLTIKIDTDYNIRINRLIARDNMLENDAIVRINTLDKLRKSVGCDEILCEYIFTNNNDADLDRVANLIKKIITSDNDISENKPLLLDLTTLENKIDSLINDEFNSYDFYIQNKKV